MIRRVLFVCMGNICRSPTAEIVFRSMLDDAGLTHIDVASAGTGGWHAGEPADRRAAQTMRAAGYDPSRHRARQVRRDDFADDTLIVAMDSENLAGLRSVAPTPEAADDIVLLRSFDPAAVASGDLDVPDPYYGGPQGFERVLDMVERACAGLVETVATQ